MTIEHPVLRLGLAGFSARVQDEIRTALPELAPTVQSWQLGDLGDADAWLLNGAGVSRVDGATLKVAAGEATARSLRLRVPDIDRPVAFTLPLALAGLEPGHTVDLHSPDSMTAMLQQFEDELSALTAQLCLASHVVEHHTVIGGGTFDVILDGRVLAVVDMHGEVGVVPGVGPAHLEGAEWRRRHSPQLPEGLARASMSQLMWQYCVRTRRDLLPRHYRTGPLYFRRPPRVSNRALRDSHLLLMRELAAGPMSFVALQRSTGLQPAQLAHDLAALYFVGTITANPKRAAPYQVPGRPVDRRDSGHGPGSSLPPEPDSGLTHGEAGAAGNLSGHTAPAPMGW